MAGDSILGPGDGDTVWLGGLGVREMIAGARSGGSFALVEHPLEPRALGAPVHTHAREDEYTYVLEGRIGFQLGDEVLEAGPGDLVFKPRGVPHAFWNASDEPARALEIISPAGFEQYFQEVGPLLAEGDERALGALLERYELDMRLETVPELVERHGLAAPGPPA